MVMLLVVSGGLSLMQLSSRSHARDLKLHHEALQEELAYTKNHLHHVEVGTGDTCLMQLNSSNLHDYAYRFQMGSCLVLGLSSQSSAASYR
jgi:hypothetical protein